jgi:hypothetical protein
MFPITLILVNVSHICAKEGAVMARLFLSYGLADQVFTSRLKRSLAALGHMVWMDEGQIRCGDSIPKEVALAVEMADFLLAVLSQHSVHSSWLEHEWYAKYWEEVTTRTVKVIPVLLEDCSIPFFLRPKRYADFRTDYQTGLFQLQQTIAEPGRPPMFETMPLCYAEDTMQHGGQLLEVQVELAIPYIGKIAGTWKPDEREQDAAWEMYVELVTRVSVADPLPTGGSLRESLASLYSLFTTTRSLLRSYGPAVARPKHGGELSFGYLAINVLNYVLRPVLTKWHPMLLDWEHQRPAEVAPLVHEADWVYAEELREVLRRVRAMLLEYSSVLAEISRVPSVPMR